MAKISVRNCTLDYPLYGVSSRSLKKMVISAATGGRIAANSREITVVRALSSLDLEALPGDRVGLWGHNGSGKTTLLRALAGIYAPSEGSIELTGSVASLIDPAMGFELDASGHENITLRGLLHGMSREQIESLRSDIAEFSGLGDYLDLPVRVYSSGMQMRLAFSIVTAVSADIILMDEWLSVGDAEFSAKAEGRLRNLIDNAKIIVLASHNLDLIRSVCNRVITLEHGKIIAEERSAAQ
ncbi:ABC transporter ATP-binding protein [Lysobacter sp. BMK333-48F3]|uniref:ABC transporter ATP-binding protein n=1 Tax=Lysobacter sp. BMK333-48F3 TaxID=2867962 RepID=UPI001C8CDC96|nr:ABC transporter ATP-binding protein [Lysobacter sp. BMK333-48F3]MBX9400135.1 ABC transporter ATP-binding protein [Lysobacter sp. BMK333-48F3]